MKGSFDKWLLLDAQTLLSLKSCEEQKAVKTLHKWAVLDPRVCKFATSSIRKK